MPGFVSLVLGIVSLVLGFVFWVLGFVFWVLGLVCWVLGFVFGCLDLSLGVPMEVVPLHRWEAESSPKSWEADRGITNVRTPTSIGSYRNCLLYTSPSPRDQRGSRMPSSA